MQAIRVSIAHSLRTPAPDATASATIVGLMRRFYSGKCRGIEPLAGHDVIEGAGQAALDIENGERCIEIGNAAVDHLLQVSSQGCLAINQQFISFASGAGNRTEESAIDV